MPISCSARPAPAGRTATCLGRSTSARCSRFRTRRRQRSRVESPIGCGQSWSLRAPDMDPVSQLSHPLISLSRQDLVALMPFGAYVEAVSDAFRMHAQGRTVLPAPMHVIAEAGSFHVKAGGLPSGPGYVAFKVNANFPNNRATNGLPTIQGAILL